MRGHTIFRGPIGFTPAESSIAAGLAVLVLIGMAAFFCQRLIRPTPRVYFEELTIPTTAAADPGVNRNLGNDDHAATPPSLRVGGRLNVNLADYTELLRLPGIGPVLATRIIEYRDLNGPFPAVDSLINVSGIGPKKLRALRLKVFVR